jgi:hypothetical protein
MPWVHRPVPDLREISPLPGGFSGCQRFKKSFRNAGFPKNHPISGG